ncbi:unnamed protein product [Rhizophagus irregularis]|nr:unnamed protein product [Rhizophagus irregularis]
MEEWFEHVIDNNPSDPKQKYVEEVDYKLDLADKITEDDLKTFQRTIEEEFVTKRNSHSGHEPFQDPSRDKSIMDV